jgi:RHS repeat-associated protein
MKCFFVKDGEKIGVALDFVKNKNEGNFKKETATPNRWELQGKEREQTFGLNRINFGARLLNNTTGVLDRVDPLAEKFHGQSPYCTFDNNPINKIDPDGAAAKDITLLGANRSSITVKTDLVDLKINASGLGVDFGGNYTLSGSDILQAAVDIGGVFDPTPTLDILGASLSAQSGDYLGAGASVLGAGLPYDT